MTTLVLHVAETVAGGIASYFEELVPAQVKALGVDRVRVLIPRSHLDHCKHLPSEVVMTYPDPSSRALRLFTLAWALLKLMFSLKPHIVHAHSSLAGVVVRVCCAGMFFRRTKVIYCAHGWAWDRESSPLMTRLVKIVEWALAWVTDAIVCISRHDHDSAIRVGIAQDKLITILNGIQQDAQGMPDDVSPLPHRNFLFVGRFDRQKGIDLYIAAMRQLVGRATGYAVGSRVLGGGAARDWATNIEAPGWVDRSVVHQYMQAADALVVPSRWEGFGLVALEAMRAGKPVIAARVGGLQDLIEDGKTGFLFEPGSPSALLSALEKALESDLNAMGRAAQERYLEHYTSERMNHRLLDLYNKVLAENAEVTQP